jgi:hypothetical protein
MRPVATPLGGSRDSRKASNCNAVSRIFAVLLKDEPKLRVTVHDVVFKMLIKVRHEPDVRCKAADERPPNGRTRNTSGCSHAPNSVYPKSRDGSSVESVCCSNMKSHFDGIEYRLTQGAQTKEE